MKSLRINELVVKVTEAVIAHGVDPLTAWTEHNSAYKPLISILRAATARHRDSHGIRRYQD